MDGERIGRSAMLAMAEDIVRRLPVPVTADLESGYGVAPQAVAETVRLAVAGGRSAATWRTVIRAPGRCWTASWRSSASGPPWRRQRRPVWKTSW
jgi:hypothetical protein